MLIRLASWHAVLSLAIASPAVAAITFTPGHFYTTDDSQDVIEYDANGQIVGSLTVPAASADSLRGLAFGPDGLLYVTAVRGTGFAVLALDASGSITHTYPGSVYVRGNLSYGKIAVDEDSLYVAGQGVLTKFARGNPASSTVIYSNNQVYDVVVLPNGHLLVAWAYGIAEITKTGALVRNLPPPTPAHYTDIRGIEYVEATNDIFVTHLGYTNFFFRIMRVDGLTGALEDHITFTYANDLFLTGRGTLLVGSWTEAPRIYGQTLVQAGSLAGDARLFATEKGGCGDGGVRAPETCDDGNTRPGDGCDATCQLEAVPVGIAARKLVVVDRPATVTGGQLTFVAHDHAITKGAGTDPRAIGVELVAAYPGRAITGGYRLPVGDTGWIANDAGGAKFVNRLAPAGTTKARTARVRSGRVVMLRGRGVGDTPFSVHAAGAPAGGVFTAYCIANGGEKTCLCSMFPACAHRSIDGGAGARLTCRSGVADPRCTAIATTSSTTTSTSSSTTTTATTTTTTSTVPVCTFVDEWFVHGGPTGVAADADGNVYIVAHYGNQVRKHDSAGSLLTAWGTPGSDDGQFNNPYALAVDGGGHVYVTDANNNRVQKFEADGTFVTSWGTLGSDNGQFNSPGGIAVDENGNVFVTDVVNQRVQKFDAHGTFLDVWFGSPTAGFQVPLGVATDGAGHAYVADTNNNLIHRFDTDGAFLSAWPGFLNPVGVATDVFGYVYASDYDGGRIDKFESDGTRLGTLGRLGSAQGEFMSLRSLATDNVGNLYVADLGNDRIQKFACQ